MWWNLAVAAISILGFLGGLRVMRTGLEGMGQGRLPAILQRFVKTPTRGIVTGTIVTGLVQSSAAITAIAVGLVASGSMAFRDALGIVLGANVGSTVTPQLLSLDLWELAIPCLAAGVLGILSSNPRWRNPSLALFGFGTVVVALETLTVALHPLAQAPWFQGWIEFAGRQPLLGVLAGCLASAMIQSSTATTIITMALASQSLIPLVGAIAIVLGANVGTCATSVLAAVGQSRAAQQVALSHVLLNVGGVLLFLPFLAPYADLMFHWTDDPAQQIANAHTVFNVVCTLLLWPVTARFANLVERLLPNNVSA
jgi:phosphate:Na+ symporter